MQWGDFLSGVVVGWLAGAITIVLILMHQAMTDVEDLYK